MSTGLGPACAWSASPQRPAAYLIPIMSDRKFFVGGNWKMNGSMSQYKSLITDLQNAKLDPNTRTLSTS